MILKTAHSRLWMQPDSPPWLLMLLVLPASSLRVNSPLDQRKAVGLTWETERLILRRDEVRETMQLGQRSQIVCAKLISPKILTFFPPPFPKATLKL